MENLIDLHAAKMVQQRQQAFGYRPFRENSRRRFGQLPYTATAAAWYSSYVPLKSVIL